MKVLVFFSKEKEMMFYELCVRRKKLLVPTGKIVDLMESLILAQDERWRHA